jgi:acyl carrier protein
MIKQDILNDLLEVFVDVFEDEDISITSQTAASDIEEWDSLNHIQLIVAIEKKFNIRFQSREIQSWKNVGEMIECIAQK